MNTLDLSIVIPTFKESAKIEADIREAHHFLVRKNLDGEIIVVDDGSTDDTVDRACSLQERYPEVIVVRYKRNRGKGHALRIGISRAIGRNILFADAGACIPYETALIGISMLELNMCDIAHGSRCMRGSVIKRSQPTYRQIGSRMFALLSYMCMGIPPYISDTQCGFKLYRHEVAQRLYSQIITDGFMYDTEVILRALRAKCRILEFPVVWSNDPDTRFDPFKGTLRNLCELLKIRFTLLLGKSSSKSMLEPFVENRRATRKKVGAA